MNYSALLVVFVFIFLVVGAMYLGLRASMREREFRKKNPHTLRGGMRSIAGTALATSSVFLLVVAVMLNSPHLFYMSTAVIATLLASRLQAWLSVRGLRFERFAPEKAAVGEVVTIELAVWSERRIRRPLIAIVDQLPSKMAATDRTASLPIAPAFDVPIRTQYRFRPMRRGRFKWSALQVHGTDALGLVTMHRNYVLETSEMLIVPTPLPLDLDLPAAAGFGIAETESGQGRGAGIEPRGVREYTYGDSIRYIHWNSSARTGRLMVKEFETGHHSTVVFIPQQSTNSDIGEGGHTTLERMCSHMAYLGERLLRQGAQVLLPTLEEGTKVSSSPHERLQEVLIALANADAARPLSLGDELLQVSRELPGGSIIYLFVSVADASLAAAIREVVGRGARVYALLYNPLEFVKNPRDFKGTSCLDPGFVGSLQASGAYVEETMRGTAH